MNLNYVNFYAEHQIETKTFWKTKKSNSLTTLANLKEWIACCKHTHTLHCIVYVYTVWRHVHTLRHNHNLSLLLHTHILSLWFLSLSHTHSNAQCTSRKSSFSLHLYYACFHSSSQFIFFFFLYNQVTSFAKYIIMPKTPDAFLTHPNCREQMVAII